ncbi:MAG TPA: multiheme c-type cytochrome [Terracidiphilus sp.]|nr:multiheme c-type cytochrome [Terracidiphilus sp.]
MCAAAGLALLGACAALCSPRGQAASVPQAGNAEASTNGGAQKEACASCHAGDVNSYAHASMRHALEPPENNPVLQTHPDLSVTIGAYTYHVQTRNGQSTYTVSDGTESMTLPIRWDFGRNAQTWVLEKDGNLYESLVSYFPLSNGLGTTPGDQALKPQTLTEAMGRKLSVWEARSCFDCHATHAVDGTKLTLNALSPGVGCERCHVGALKHQADAEHDDFRTLPRALKKLDSESLANFCGQCHRTWDVVVRNHWHGPAFVRFQPYRLELSKCFIGNDSRIGCLACHNPHQEVRHDEAFYDSKCMACHGPAPAHASQVMYKACPVSTTKCISCHMPKVSLPGGQQEFTDHYIRIVRAGEPYPD